MHASRAIDDPWPLGAWEGVKRRPLRSLFIQGSLDYLIVGDPRMQKSTLPETKPASGNT